MATFNTQDGNNRTYTDGGYQQSQLAGAMRRSPGGGQQRPLISGAQGGGYTPPYAKYADPAVAATAAGGQMPNGTTAGAGYYSAIAGIQRPQDPSNPYQQQTYAKQVQYAQSQNKTPLLGGYFDAFKNGLSGAVQGYGDLAGQDFKQQVGTLLGNLNSIGGLRSGGVQAGVDQAMAQYGRQIGDYASMTANQAGQLAQQENDLNNERQYRDRSMHDAKRAAHNSALGHILGGAAGIVGGIPGIGTVAGGILKGIGGLFG